MFKKAILSVLIIPMTEMSTMLDLSQKQGVIMENIMILKWLNTLTIIVIG